MIKLKDGFQGERAFVLPPAFVTQLEEHPLSAILHITDIGYYPNAVHHYRERNEAIPQFVFIYCINGSGWYSVGGKRYEVKADNYFILPAGEPHAYGASESDPWTIYWIHFKGTLASVFAGTERRPVEVKPGMMSRISHRIGMFEEIMTILDKGYSRENLLYACSVFHHFLGSLRYLNQYRDSAQEDAGAGDDVVSIAIRYMQENIEKQLRLADLACHVGYSASQFSQLFSQGTGYSPMTYFNQLKIKHACSLLDFSDIKINQICHKVGIADTYYFSRLFAKVMGVSPTAYRKVKKG